MTFRTYRLIGLLLALLWLLFGGSKAHAQTAPTVTLDASQFMTALFGMPSQEVLAQVFWIGLSTPLTGYLVAYCVGLFVNFWNERG